MAYRRFTLVVSVAIVLIIVGVAVLRPVKLQAPALIHDQYDVVVVGAGPGGIAASIQAARMGAHVALFEPTDWIGGQMTAAGIGTMDEGSMASRRSGIYKDFVSRVVGYYASVHKSVGTCYYDPNTICVDPAVGQEIFRQMLDNAGSNLQVFTHSNVSSVIKKGNTVTGVVVNGRAITTKVLIDGDEFGDVLAQAGAAYRLGTGTDTNPVPGSCVQAIAYAAVIRYYPDGVPKDLQFKAPPPGYTQQLADYFANFLRNDGGDHFSSHAYTELSFTSFTAARGLPDLLNKQDYNALQNNGHTITRTVLVGVNDYPLTGGLVVKYVNDPAYREAANCEAKLLTLQLMYYIQHDMHETKWSVANDEGYNTAYNESQHCAILKGYEAFEDQMPQEPYVREGRRLIGVATLTGNELAEVQHNQSHSFRTTDSVAVGYYPMDLHACYAPLEAKFDSPNNLSQQVSGRPFEVPIGVLIPQQVDGLLAVEKNISVSRQANGAIREQPIAMATGQAAGALAALAVSRHEQPRHVPYTAVQQALLAYGAEVTIPYK